MHGASQQKKRERVREGTRIADIGALEPSPKYRKSVASRSYWTAIEVVAMRSVLYETAYINNLLIGLFTLKYRMLHIVLEQQFYT